MTTTRDTTTDEADWPTTRRYPRSLQEAWPTERVHAYDIERVYGARFERMASVALAVAIGSGLAMVLVAWWSS